ncbi:hypothetical protein CY35_10G091900 [Sphagnum magellanicum]|nr:hypothetical protein CY35_10G091900 [Sphagnum magellanicum]
MKKWLHTAMSSIVSIRMQLQERACCGVPCRMPLILGESISSYPGAPWHGRSLSSCKTSIHGLLTCSLTWHLNPLDSCNPWCLKRSLCSKQQRGKAWKCTPSSLVQMADLSTNEIQEITSESNTIQGSEEKQSAKLKKKVAMWVGYVGTHYKGLQMQRGPNSGQVHSLCTVISMKMEVPIAAWVNDFDGITLAESINMHLPPFIRIFGIVPVTRSFRARHDCCTRTYNYLLPAAIIGIQADTSPLEVEECVEKFQSILGSFKGKHAYHNYTIRRLYRCFSQKPFVSRQVYDKRCIDLADDPIIEAYPQVPADGELVNLEADMLDEDEEPSDDVAMLLTHELADDMLNTFAEDCKGEFQKPSESTNATLGTDVTGRRAWWLPTPDEADKVVSSHFRSVISCTCAMPEIFRGARFIRISITGNSFMVHQIRKMIGTAVAVFMDLLPPDTIPISLARHARVVLPLAPSDGLILASNSFTPFRIPSFHLKSNSASGSAQQSKRQDLPRLEMSKAIADRVDSFNQEVLMPEIGPLVSEAAPTWSAWIENLERNAKIPESEFAQVRAAWVEWREHTVRLRQMRMQIDKEWVVLPETGLDMSKPSYVGTDIGSVQI